VPRDAARQESPSSGRRGSQYKELTGLAPMSNIVGAALIHAIWVEAGERLVARGHVPEVWGSANRGPV
jgi:uncharacterized phosphosugar-binding protein